MDILYVGLATLSLTVGLILKRAAVVPIGMAVMTPTCREV